MPTFYCTQRTFSFDNQVASPAQLSVFIIDGTTGTGTTMYETYDYTIDWQAKTVTMLNPIVLGNRIQIDVYEIGNGDQLVKSNSDVNPIRMNDATGFYEIYLDCNYTGSMYAGSGIIVAGTTPAEVTATATSALDHTILCDNVSEFILNAPITFTGVSFGDILADTTYFVKTIGLSSKRITISSTLAGGLAGPVYFVSTSTGTMNVVISVGTADVYTPPLVYCNGLKLIKGARLNISSTSSVNNAITCNTTTVLAVDNQIMFSNSIFGGVLMPMILYYIKTIIDSNEFTVSLSIGGPVVTLTTASGGSTAIVDDYAFDTVGDYMAAKIIFANTMPESDYMSYAVFGQTEPAQYGYTIPEREIFTGSTNTVYALSNYIGGDNPTNAIVEINGIRLTNSAYTVSGIFNNLTLSTAPLITDKIVVTSYNLTDRQYLHTQYGLTGNTVSKILYIDNVITPALAVTNVTSTTSPSTINCDSTLNFVADQTVIFQIGSSGSSFGNIDTSGTVYYIKTIINLTSFTVSLTQGGAVYTGLTAGSGLVVATVGGTPAVRVQTTSAHSLTSGDIIRIDGVTGSVQLNNTIFYARVVNSTTYDLYTAPYNPVYAATNLPLTDVFTYVSGGYSWKDRIYTLVTTTITHTEVVTNVITCSSSLSCIIDTPIIFTELGKVAGDLTLGGLVIGTTYYIIAVDNAMNQIQVSLTYQGVAFVLTTASGTANATQWEQQDVNRLWVTLNGHRVPSSALRINSDNNLSILTIVVPADEVIITNMIPSGTPSELTYIQTVSKYENAAVYRANQQTRTWLTAVLIDTDSIIELADVTKVTNTLTQVEVAPAAVLGEISIALTADKRIISQVLVFNETTSEFVSSINYRVDILHLAPVLYLKSGVQYGIIEGQTLKITIISGNLVFVAGEQIKFSKVDLLNNTLSGLQRGANGTGMQQNVPMFTEVYGLTSENRLPDALYAKTFSESDYADNDGDVDGGPLQFEDTPAGVFLQRDIK